MSGNSILFGDRPHPPLVLGLVGGIASGKSFVADLLRELGAGVLDADRAGHDVLRLAEVENEVRRRWGEAVFGPNGHIDRAALGAVVFSPGEQGVENLRELERITHPRIGERIAQQAVQYADEGVLAIVLDAPVMLEAGWNQICDRIIYVDAPYSVRLERALARGWTEEEFRRREANQEALEVKRSLADVVLDNSTSPESTREQVLQFWHSMLGQQSTQRMSRPL